MATETKYTAQDAAFGETPEVEASGTDKDTKTLRPFSQFVEFVRGQEKLDDVADMLKHRVDNVLDQTKDRDKLLSCLRGEWFGHALHPALTSIPLGAWTFAAVIDAATIFGKPSRASTLAVAIGLGGATMAAATGLADWHDMKGKARRTGTAHALLNSTATTLYAASLLGRVLNFGAPRLLSFVGFGVASASAYLGGDLVFGEHEDD